MGRGGLPALWSAPIGDTMDFEQPTRPPTDMKHWCSKTNVWCKPNDQCKCCKDAATAAEAARKETT